MVQLVLVYCLARDALSCIERRPQLASFGPMACMIAAQPIAARFLQDHPAYTLSSWRCELRSRRERAL